MRHLARCEGVAHDVGDHIRRVFRLAGTYGAAWTDRLGDRPSHFVGNDRVRLRAAAVDPDHDERHATVATGSGASSGCVIDERIPITSVIVVPMRTYHGHAILPSGVNAGMMPLNCLANTMNAIVAIPTDIPRMASN